MSKGETPRIRVTRLVLRVVGSIDKTIIVARMCSRMCIFCIRLCAFLTRAVRLRVAVGNNCWVDRRALPPPVEDAFTEFGKHSDVSGRPSKIGPLSRASYGNPVSFSYSLHFVVFTFALLLNTVYLMCYMRH